MASKPIYTVASFSSGLDQAAFDRKPDAAGLGYWIDYLDKGPRWPMLQPVS